MPSSSSFSSSSSSSSSSSASFSSRDTNHGVLPHHHLKKHHRRSFPPPPHHHHHHHHSSPPHDLHHPPPPSLHHLHHHGLARIIERPKPPKKVRKLHAKLMKCSKRHLLQPRPLLGFDSDDGLLSTIYALSEQQYGGCFHPYHEEMRLADCCAGMRHSYGPPRSPPPQPIRGKQSHRRHLHRHWRSPPPVHLHQGVYEWSPYGKHTPPPQYSPGPMGDHTGHCRPHLRSLHPAGCDKGPHECISAAGCDKGPHECISARMGSEIVVAQAEAPIAKPQQEVAPASI